MRAINTSTVRHLRIAWKIGEGFGQETWETFPVVRAGRMYLTTNTNGVWALDAATGKTLWKYTPRVDFVSASAAGGGDSPTNRGVAVAGGRVYELTYDCHLLALRARDGTLLWKVPVASPRLGYYETAAPTVWGGLVFVGSSGGDNGARGFVAAYDARTGKRVWKRWAVPAPGQGWVPKQGHHGGGAVWMPPTVDPGSGVLYVATGNPSPNFDATARPGGNPYTDGILALRARTGAVLWFHPSLSGDEWDYDAASPVSLFKVRRAGQIRRAVGEAGKSGYYMILDASTGAPLFPPLSFVTQRHPLLSARGALICPGNLGGSEYSPTSYNPHTHAVYVSGINACMLVRRAAPGVAARHQAGKPDLGGSISLGPGRPSGTFTAINVDTGKARWVRDMPTPMVGGSLSTAGELVFSGGANGVLYGFDARTGRQVWSWRTGSSIGSAPIAYEVHGREYLALISGGSVAVVENHLGRPGGTLLVFSLAG